MPELTILHRNGENTKIHLVWSTPVPYSYTYTQTHDKFDDDGYIPHSTIQNIHQKPNERKIKKTRELTAVNTCKCVLWKCTKYCLLPDNFYLLCRRMDQNAKQKNPQFTNEPRSSQTNKVSNGTLAYAIAGISPNMGRPIDELSSESNSQILPHTTSSTTAVIQRSKLVDPYYLCFSVAFN